MTDKPIIFSAPMVRALLDGRKTQTRRILKPQPVAAVAGFERVFKEPPFFEARDAAGKPVERAFPYPKGFVSPYPRLAYAPGDRLWVRETWSAIMDGGWTIADARRRMFNEKIVYRADGNGYEDGDGWWPSIHMPREFSRLTLTVTEVRVQRLQEISAYDVQAEGACELACLPPVEEDEIEARGIFRDLWNSLHGPDAWDANPWVVALTFTAQHGNIDRIGKA